MMKNMGFDGGPQRKRVTLVVARQKTLNARKFSKRMDSQKALILLVLSSPGLALFHLGLSTKPWCLCFCCYGPHGLLGVICLAMLCFPFLQEVMVCPFSARCFVMSVASSSELPLLVVLVLACRCFSCCHVFCSFMFVFIYAAVIDSCSCCQESCAFGGQVLDMEFGCFYGMRMLGVNAFQLWGAVWYFGLHAAKGNALALMELLSSPDLIAPSFGFRLG
ncbi:hypothetical protein U1Q18_010316 [Sarracenia purpurea var. burkii]